MATRTPLILLVLAVLLFSCAKQVPPSGGPKDTEPPTIIATEPLSGTTNFRGDRISVEFSEYIDKGSARDAVFISPSVENFKLDWSGKTLEVFFKDSLKKNTTYTVTFGTGIRDLNNKNRMAEAFTLVFSTGEKIDKGEISGFVFDPKPQDVHVFCYKLSDSNYVNPSLQKPDYITQCGDDGFYLFSGLGKSSYLLFAVKDENGDNLYGEGEAIGVQSGEVTLKSDSAKVTDVNFKLTKIDTVAPEIDEIVMTDRNHILAKYSETIDSAKLNANQFQIIDSTTLKIYPVKYAYKGKVKREKVLFAFNLDSLAGEGLYFIAGEVYDKSGNKSKKTETEIYYNNKPDTLAPQIVSVIPANGEKKLSLTHPAISVLFDDGVNFSATSCSLKDEKGRAVKFSVQKVNDAEFLILPKNKLRSSSEYKLEIDFSALSDAAGNKKDTTITYKLETLDAIDLVSVEGTVVSAKGKSNVFVVLNKIKGNRNYKTKAGASGKFKFASVLPGKYFIWAFEDKNRNGEYDYGSPMPLKYSEKFYFRNDTLNIRPRWPVKNVNL